MLLSLSFPPTVSTIATMFQRHGSIPEKSVIKEVATALAASHPLLKSIAKGGSLSTSYLRNNFYRKNFDVIEPTEYMLDEKENKSFQYVPLLKCLQQLFNRKDVIKLK